MSNLPIQHQRSNQSVLKEINPEYSLEGPMLRLKFQYFGHLIQRADALERTLMLGNIEGKRKRGQQSMRKLDSITNSMDMNLNRHQEMVMDRGGWHTAARGVTRSWTQLSNGTTTAIICIVNLFTKWCVHLRQRKSHVHFQIFQIPIRYKLSDFVQTKLYEFVPSNYILLCIIYQGLIFGPSVHFMPLTTKWVQQETRDSHCVNGAYL